MVDLDAGHIPKVIRCNLATGEWLAYKLDAAGNLLFSAPGTVMLHQGRGRIKLVPVDEADAPALVTLPETT